MKQRTLVMAGALIGSVLIGCGSDDDASTDDRTDEQVDATDAGDQDVDDQETDDGADDGAPDDVAGGPEDGAEPDDPVTGEVAVGQTQVHGGGLELTIEAIRVEGDAIFVDLEAFNASSTDASLATFSEIDLVDDTGRTYNYRPPEDNPSLDVEVGGTLEGSIAFLGRLTPDATSLRLRFNYDGDLELEPSDGPSPEYADAPSFEFADLPLPGR